MSAPSRLPSTSRDVEIHLREIDDGSEVGKGIDGMRKRIRVHEVLLEFRFHRRFDLFDPVGYALNFLSSVDAAQSDSGAGARCIARRSDAFQKAVRNHAEDHGVLG